MSTHAAPARGSTVSRALARDKLGMFAVLAFILASIAPMTVSAGVIPTAFAVTGDRGAVRQRGVGDGSPRRPFPRSRRGGAGTGAAVRPQLQRRLGTDGPGAVHDLAVRRRAVVSQRDLAVHVRAVPRGRPARRAEPYQPGQHPPGRLLSALLLAAAIVLAIMHFGTLLGTGPGNPAAWLLPSAFGVAAVAGLCWGTYLRARRPGVYATIGLGAHAAGQATPASGRTRS